MAGEVIIQISPDSLVPVSAAQTRGRLAVRDQRWLAPKPVTLRTARQSSQPVIRADMHCWLEDREDASDTADCRRIRMCQCGLRGRCIPFVTLSDGYQYTAHSDHDCNSCLGEEIQHYCSSYSMLDRQLAVRKSKSNRATYDNRMPFVVEDDVLDMDNLYALELQGGRLDMVCRS